MQGGKATGSQCWQERQHSGFPPGQPDRCRFSPCPELCAIPDPGASVLRAGGFGSPLDVHVPSSVLELVLTEPADTGCCVEGQGMIPVPNERWMTKGFRVPISAHVHAPSWYFLG